MKRCFILTLAVALLAPAGLAKANTYDVYACWAGFGTFRNPNAATAAWTKDQAQAAGHFAVSDDCGTNTASGAMSITSTSGTAATGQYAELAFSAPTGTTIAGATLWRSAWTYGSGSGTTSQRNYLTMLTDGGTLSSDSDGTSDVPFGTRGSGDTTNHGIVNSNQRAVNLGSRAPSKLSYRIGCGFDASCPTGSLSGPPPSYSATGIRLFGAIVSIDDSAPPFLSLEPSGLLSGQTAEGTRSVLVHSASDVSGIKTLAVFADDAAAPIGILDYEQDVNECDWTLRVPCPNVTDTEVPVDTRQLSDGLHAIVVKAFDAADNAKTSSTYYVTVDNRPKEEPAPDPTPTPDPTPDPTPNPTRPGPASDVGLPNGIEVGRGDAGAAPIGAPALSVAFARNGTPRVKAKFGGAVTIVGHLRDGRGASIANAQIDFSAMSTRAGARAQDLGALRTDANGAFSFKVATKLGSRELRFAYSPQIGGPVAVSARAQLDVIAPVSLKASPKHTRNKHAVVFTGHLAGGPIPRRGKIVNLQVVVDGHWHTFATVRTSSSGRFKYRYRFMRTYRRVTYRFRARSRYEAAYPFVAGTSAAVRVRVN